MIRAGTIELLKAAYDELAYTGNANLIDSNVSADCLGESDYIDKGDWLKLASEVKAEKVFFLDNNPVAIFARHDSDDVTTLRKLYNSIWCMARPRLLFLAKPGELAVYDLACEPSRTDADWEKSKGRRALAIAHNVEQVAVELKKFHREQLESGSLFEDSEIRFGDIANRADKALINDLKVVRQELIKKGLGDSNLKYAHALIGRSIFIRYLEDRAILIPDDFYDVAKGHPNWKGLLDERHGRLECGDSETASLYPRVLRNKDFTYALFRKLATDFNGDMFPDIAGEKGEVTPAHLELIRSLLYGDAGPQKKLFFYAYQFKIVPIELISSIYEEFYHKEAESKAKAEARKRESNSQGAYYTPPALVEFLLSKVLTPERLAKSPRILDPACGSGIFLVESFRRIVRYRSLKQGRRLRFDELKKVLREQLAGIDVEPEAIRVAAFSLYLALLHYLDPPSIREQIAMGNRLPNLVVDKKNTKRESFNTLLAANAFDSNYIASTGLPKASFLSECADIVVGNPPWGAPDTKDKKAVADNKLALAWCKANNRPVGQKERSQMFMWRALDALKQDGISALLVHMNVFLMHHDNSERFRDTWLSESSLRSVWNFSHTRKVFFKGAIAPFAAVLFGREKAKTNGQVEYWSSRNTRMGRQLQSVVFRRNDLKCLRSDQDLTSYITWKLYWWGNHHDENLISNLARHLRLSVLSPPELNRRGFEAGSEYDATWLTKYRAIRTSDVHRYGEPHPKEAIPDRVNRRGSQELYHGLRLLVKRGIEQKSKPKGQIIATMAEHKFAFRNSVYGIKLIGGERWQYECILGILWSSIAQYFLLLTSYDWGVWHDEIRLEDELLELPICLPQRGPLRNRLLRIVRRLQARGLVGSEATLFDGRPSRTGNHKPIGEHLDAELDEVVFELYGLSDAEQDLIRDMCQTNLEYYYLPDKGKSGKPALASMLMENHGTIRQLPEGIGKYLKAFIQSWNPYLDKNTQLCWRVHQPTATDAMFAIVFSIRTKSTAADSCDATEDDSWASLLLRMGSSMTHHFGSSKIFIEGLVRVVTDDQIIIIKGNESRLWTPSMAREDAEATLIQAMNRGKIGEGNAPK